MFHISSKTCHTHDNKPYSRKLTFKSCCDKSIAIKQNEKKLANYQSVGEYLYKEYFQKFKENSKEFINVRNKKESYERYIVQSFLKDELKLIFQKQREFGFSFSKNLKKKCLV